MVRLEAVEGLEVVPKCGDASWVFCGNPYLIKHLSTYFCFGEQEEFLPNTAGTLGGAG